MTTRLHDKVALVTGGGSGIGEATCLRFAEEGARVAVLDIDASAAQLTAKLTGEGYAVTADVSDSAAFEAAFAQVEAELGPVDILVNNAGIAGRENAERISARADQQIAEAGNGRIETSLDALVRLSDEEWAAMLAVHLNGTFYGTRAAARSMAGRGGAIVNIGSICGIEGCAGYPHYSAAKGAILAFTRAVAKELSLQGIRVNAIAPGFTDTPILNVMTDLQLAVLKVATPMARLARPEEIAATAAFLASDDASFYTGETLSPNGGLVTV